MLSGHQVEWHWVGCLPKLWYNWVLWGENCPKPESISGKTPEALDSSFDVGVATGETATVDKFIRV